MRKPYLLFVCLGMLLSACSGRELGTNSAGEGPEGSSFLSVRIVSAGASGTRAYDKDGGSYKDGTVGESYVHNVLLLLFNAAGDPVNIVVGGDGGSKSWFLLDNVDDDNAGSDTGNGETVEKILEDVQHLRVPAGLDDDMQPTRILAIVNPPQTEPYLNKPLSQLKDFVEDYRTGLTGRGNGEKDFVMTNAVYADGSQVVDATPLKPGDFYETADEAAENPVIIYVERVLARLDLTIDITGTEIGDGSYIYHTGEQLPQEKGIYVRFLGWNVFSSPDRSRLLKHIDPAWQDDDVFANGLKWNSAPLHRSFWAINPPENRFNYLRGAFHEKEAGGDTEFRQWYADNLKIPACGEYSTVYLQENAAPFENAAASPTDPTEVILAAQLVDEKGEALRLARWAGKTYTWEDMRAELCMVLDLYYFAGYGADGKDNPPLVYKRISPEDLDYEKVPGSSGATVVLSDAGKQKTWRCGTQNSSEELVDTDAVNKYIEAKLGTANLKVWENGYTYFHFAIRHLGEENARARYGIVRNHLYEAHVTSVAGLGTPVYDPDEIIIPSDDPETGVVSAEIRILSWRMVRQDYELSW